MAKSKHINWLFVLNTNFSDLLSDGFYGRKRCLALAMQYTKMQKAFK